MHRPRYVAHIPMLELVDSSVTRRIAAVRSGDEVTFRPLLPPSHEFENRYSCIGYHAKHYAALELIVNEKTVVVYEGLSAESSFKDLSTYLLYKYSIVDANIDVRWMVNSVPARSSSRRGREGVQVRRGREAPAVFA